MPVVTISNFTGPLNFDQLLFTTSDEFRNAGGSMRYIRPEEDSPIWSAAASSAHSNSSTVYSTKRGRPALSEKDRLANGFCGSLEDFRAYRKRLSSKMSAQRTSAKKQIEMMAQARQLQVVTEEYSQICKTLSQTQVENQELKKQLEDYKALTAKLLAIVGNKDAQPSAKIMRTMTADTSLVAPKWGFMNTSSTYVSSSSLQTSGCSGCSGSPITTNMVSTDGSDRGILVEPDLDESCDMRRSSSASCDATVMVNPIIKSDLVDLYNSIMSEHVFDDTNEVVCAKDIKVIPRGVLGSTMPIPVPRSLSGIQSNSSVRGKQATDRTINNPVPSHQHHRTPYGRRLMYVLTVLCIMSVYYLDLDPAALGLEKSRSSECKSTSNGRAFGGDDFQDTNFEYTFMSCGLLESLQFRLQDGDFDQSFVPTIVDVCNGVRSLFKVRDKVCNEPDRGKDATSHKTTFNGELPGSFTSGLDTARRRGIGRRRVADVTSHSVESNDTSRFMESACLKAMCFRYCLISEVRRNELMRRIEEDRGGVSLKSQECEIRVLGVASNSTILSRHESPEVMHSSFFHDLTTTPSFTSMLNRCVKLNKRRLRNGSHEIHEKGFD